MMAFILNNVDLYGHNLALRAQRQNLQFFLQHLSANLPVLML